MHGTHADWGRSISTFHGVQLSLRAQDSTIEENWIFTCYIQSCSVDSFLVTDGCLANANLQGGLWNKT